MALVPRLLKKNPLSFIRVTENTGYTNDEGTWIEGDPTIEPILATGNLQPHLMGKERVDLPEGISARHIKVYYTQTKLVGVDDIKNQEPDTTTIDGIEFVVYDMEDWDTPAYNCKHYKVYLVRKDKL